MATGLRVEDRLDGVVNFSPWKERITLILQENELWDIVENTQTSSMTVPADATLLAAYTKKNIKAKELSLMPSSVRICSFYHRQYHYCHPTITTLRAP
jgi:hypothetical protein